MAIWDDFEVVGSKIYDPNGQEFIAKGVNINGPGFGWMGSTPNQVHNVQKWGFNTIRLNVRDLEPANLYPENGTIDQIVQNYTNQGMVVIIEAHENTGKFFSNEQLLKLTEWHKNLATQYKDNPYVWLNVSNEPGGHDSATAEGSAKYLNQNISVITAIRATGFDNPIVVDGWYWGQDVGFSNSETVSEEASALLSQGQTILNADPLKNTLFSVHTYDQWSTNPYGKMNDYIDRVHGKGLAMVVGEYGSENGGRFPETVAGVLPSAQEKEVGRLVWAWQGGDAFDLTTAGGGYKINFKPDGSMPDNLSWLGQQTWADNQQPEQLEKRWTGLQPVSASSPMPVPKPLRLEAEALTLKGNGFTVEASNIASGGSFSRLKDDSHEGKLTGVFRGVSGTYTVVVGYWDETAGESTATLNLQGTDRLSWQWNNPTQGASDDMEPSNFRWRSTEAVSLTFGDRFTLSLNANGTERGRVDYIDFLPIAVAGASLSTVNPKAVNPKAVNPGAVNPRAVNPRAIGAYSQVPTLASSKAFSERITGSATSDRLIGGSQRDVLLGGGGADTLHGRGNQDWLVGGTGGDRLYGGAGDDVLTGNAGRDVFVLYPDAGTDIIRDFQNGVDRIALTGGLNANDLAVKALGQHTAIVAGGTVVMTLYNVSPNHITVADFTLQSSV